MLPADDPILKRFRAALDELYGERAERVVLFGSRARGDARKDSDYDIAVFINNPGNLSAELHRLCSVSTQIAAATPLHQIVAREAYLAASHAVEAYLFECTGKAASLAAFISQY
jgi:predicted nucleotidyltransferase